MQQAGAFRAKNGENMMIHPADGRDSGKRTRMAGVNPTQWNLDGGMTSKHVHVASASFLGVRETSTVQSTGGKADMGSRHVIT